MNYTIFWSVVSIAVAWLVKPLITSYVNEKGKNFATKEDIAEITRTTKTIETQLSGDQWQRQMVWNQKRDIYFQIFAAAHEVSEKCTDFQIILSTQDHTNITGHLEEFDRARIKLTNLIPISKLFLTEEAFTNILEFCKQPLLPAHLPDSEWVTITRKGVMRMSNNLVIIAKKDLGITH